jgi:FkbM family methyltransferase
MVRLSDHSSTSIRFGNETRQLHFRQRSTDEIVIKQVLVGQQYDLRRLRRAVDLFEFAQRQRGAGGIPLVIDAGANIGAAALYFALNMPEALVLAVEPESENFQLLSKNVSGLNVKSIHAALASSAGRAEVFDPGEGHWGYRTRHLAHDDGKPGTINRVSINDLYQSHPAPFFPFIVKVDIEGGEGDLFSANTEWVARTPLLIIELHGWLLLKGGTSRPFLQCISKLDRDFVYFGEDIYSIANNLDELMGVTDGAPAQELKTG